MSYQIQQMKQLASSEDEIRSFADTPGLDNYQVNQGNLTVLSRRRLHISIGPDYPFTIFALLFILAMSYGILKTGTLGELGIIEKIVNLFFALFTMVSFIITVLGNPGLYDQLQNDEPKIKFCETCKVFKPKRVFHCQRCNVCIEGYDHHCPWVSKCIGRGNIIQFYIFVTSMPITFMYFGYLVYSLMSNNHNVQQ